MLSKKFLVLASMPLLSKLRADLWAGDQATQATSIACAAKMA